MSRADGRDGGPPIMEVLMHEVLKDDFEQWLNSRGLVLQRCPFLDEDPNLPVYNVAPGEERIQAAFGKQHHLRGTVCSCGEWEAQLGESITRGFDKHLKDVQR